LKTGACTLGVAVTPPSTGSGLSRRCDRRPQQSVHKHSCRAGPAPVPRRKPTERERKCYRNPLVEKDDTRQRGSHRHSGSISKPVS